MTAYTSGTATGNAYFLYEAPAPMVTCVNVVPQNTANTTPWLMRLNDGTTSMVVKAASSAAVATDPAVVVALSPNTTGVNNITLWGNTAVVNGGVAGLVGVGGNIANGVAPTANPIGAAGWDGTLTRRLLTDTVGAQQKGNSSKATYAYSATGVAAVSTNYVLGVIEAGASKVVRIRKITIWNPGSITTAQLLTISLVRQTAAGSGTAGTPAPLDSADAAYSGTLRVPGSTNGTAGTVLYQVQMWVPTAAANAQPFVIDFTHDLKKAPTIAAGVANGIYLRADNGAAGAAGLSYTIEFTEE